MRGGDLTFYRPDQGGRGLGGVLKSIQQEAMPDIKTAVKRVAKRKAQSVFRRGKQKMRRLVGQRGGAFGTKMRRPLRTLSLPKQKRKKKRSQQGGAFKRGQRRRRAPSQRRKRRRRHRDIFG